MTKLAIDRETLNTLTAQMADWLKAERIKGMEQYEKLPFPVRTDEAWRRTSPKWVELEGKKVVAPSTEFGQIGEGSSPDGVSFGCIHDLYDEKLMKLMARKRDNGINSFTAVNQALWQGGTVLNVGQDVNAKDLALHATHTFQGGDNALALPKSVVHVGKFSKVSVIETFRSDDAELLACPVIDIKVEDGSDVRYVFVQDWGEATNCVPMIRTEVGKDAHLQVLYVGLNGKVSKLFVESDLEGQGCKSEVNGLVMASHKQHFDFDLNQYHRVGCNVSDVLFHVALADESRSNFSGNVLCEPGSQKIDGYQQNRNLLLSDRARADSMPKLEIQANDVACTHGATFTTYNQDQFFYCRTRGLNEAEAKRLLVRGFFQEVVNRVEQPVVVDYLMDLVAEKMDHVLGK
ncbi:MAG: SufD family Fe-S cluster assembly protein [Vulcanimicrobiota bacterium]